MFIFLIGNTLARLNLSKWMSHKISYGQQVIKKTLEHAPKNYSTSKATEMSDVIVYSYKADKKVIMMNVFGLLQGVFWFNMASISQTPMKTNKPSIFTNFQEKYKSGISIGCCALGAVVMFFSFAFPLRSISKITLIKNRSAVNIATYSYLGKQRSFTTGLDNISCKFSRDANGAYLPMKIKGKLLYFLMDKNVGIFHEPKLFDHVVGLQRILK